MIDQNTKAIDEAELKHYGFEFKGKTGEYFRIWIVNIFLSIVTLGIYSAWAKVRTKRYFYGNTFLDDSSFDYTAEPVQILKGRFIALILFGVYQAVAYFLPQFADIALAALVVIAPLVILLSLRFRLRNTVWRGIRFDFETHVHQAYWLFLPPILYFVVLALIPFVLDFDVTLLDGNEEDIDAETGAGLFMYFKVLGVLIILAALVFPWWQKKYYDFVGKYSRYGRSPFALALSTKEFYRMYLVALVMLAAGGFCLYLILVGLLPRASYTSGQDFYIWTSMAGVIILYVVAIVYVMTKKTNLIYSHLMLSENAGEEKIHFRCTLSIPYMFYLYITNTLAIVFTLTLAMPWAMIRTARYRASQMALQSSSLEAFLAKQKNDQNALGEELGEMFGLDIGL